MIEPKTMYTSVRQEILDQKKCQFNLFGASITLTSAILAYGAATKVGALVYVVPILLNVLSIVMILEKATSIQRMVGYLQLMESEFEKYNWMWEYHLSIFRSCRRQRGKFEEWRRHIYVITVSLILTTINILCAALYFKGPEMTLLRTSKEWGQVSEFYGEVKVVVVAFLLSGVLIIGVRWLQLMGGPFSGEAVRNRWLEVLNHSKVK